MSSIRIFTYLPNPRIWKATITGRLCDVIVEVRGAPIAEMPNWLWDFDARALTETEQEELAHLRRGGKTGFSTGLIKTDAFLELNPFGTVPVAFDTTGSIGIFESNGIMRTVARLGGDKSSVTSNLRFRIGEVIAWLTRYVTLEPGDLVHMGTAARGKYGLRELDFQRWDGPCAIEISGIGKLSNPVVREDLEGRPVPKLPFVEKTAWPPRIATK